MKSESNELQQLFDLPSSDGVTASERILTALCRKTFLRLWSQTNVFTDEGFRDGKGSANELCDALVIFGNDVIIFSDKHINYQSDRDVGIAWPRWYRRAVLDSCKQLHGALAWLNRFPDRAFLDARCTRKLAVAIPASPRFHLVAVTRGSREAVLKFKEGAGLGSFDLNSSVEGQAHLQNPFVVGLPEPKKHFVHVFDEVAIDLVLSELDTAADFIDYLLKRQTLLGRSGSTIVASGEEELLASFLQTTTGDGTQHAFFDLPEDSPPPDLALFQAGIWEALICKPEYARKKEADSISYEWDQLIDRFLEYGDPGAHSVLLKQTGEQSEQGLRLMAAEKRYSRRQLAGSLIHAMHRVEPGGRIARTVYTGVAGEPVYVFLILAKRDEETYDEYRRYRIALLHAYVQVARLQAPLGTTFVGIAFDNPHKTYKGGSEDLFVLIKDAWTEQELQELEAKKVELGLWKRGEERFRYRQDEFPQAEQFTPFRKDAAADRPARPRNNSEQKAEKRARKASDASRRKNRRKKR